MTALFAKFLGRAFGCIERCFDWWAHRITHIFTGEKRRDNLFQRGITLLCVSMWRIGLFFVWLFVFFLVCSRRVKVRNKTNVSRIDPENLLLCANHGSLLGPGLVPLVLRMPQMLINPRDYFIWQTPRKNIINTPFMQLGKLSPIIPVSFDKNGVSRDHAALTAVIKESAKHTFLIFPEGGRSAKAPLRRTKSGVLLGKPLLGVGYIVYRARPRVVPILIKNEDYFLPYHKPFWLGIALMPFKIAHIFGPSIEIVFGKEIDFSSVAPYDPKVKKGELQNICGKMSEKIMEEIAALDT